MNYLLLLALGTAAIGAIGVGIYRLFGDYVSWGEDKQKLKETNAELADEKAKADITAERRTDADTGKRLDDGTF